MTLRIIEGDARVVLQDRSIIPDRSVDLIVTSPPYYNARDYGTEEQIGHGQSYIDYLESLLDVWVGCERVLRPNGKLAVNLPLYGITKKENSEQHNRRLLNISADNASRIVRNTALEFYDTYVWWKGRKVQAMFGSYPYPGNLYSGGSVEYIDIFVSPGRPSRYPDGVKRKSKMTEEEWSSWTDNLWHIQPESSDEHPAVFPLELPSRLIRMFTFAGGTVLDPFCGRGTTLLAARHLDRDAVGIEMNPRFVELARRYAYTDVPDIRSFTTHGWSGATPRP